jgi:hypothetical protein
MNGLPSGMGGNMPRVGMGNGAFENRQPKQPHDLGQRFFNQPFQQPFQQGQAFPQFQQQQFQQPQFQPQRQGSLWSMMQSNWQPNGGAYGMNWGGGSRDFDERSGYQRQPWGSW